MAMPKYSGAKALKVGCVCYETVPNMELVVLYLEQLACQPIGEEESK